MVYDEASQSYSVGDWSIKAKMNATKPAIIQVSKTDISTAMVSGGSLIRKGKTYNVKISGSSKLIEVIDGKELYQEVSDEIPAVIRKVMSRK